MDKLLDIFDVVVSAENNPIVGPDFLGIVLRKENNGFIRQTAAVIIFENLKFCDCIEADIGIEINLTKYGTQLLKGIPFNTDNDITKAIKSGVFEKVFATIRKQLEQEVSNETLSS